MQPWESAASDATAAWDVYRGIASVGSAGVATIAAVKTWMNALARKNAHPGDPLYVDFSDAFATRGIAYLVAHGLVTSDGTTLTATTPVTGGASPRALRRAANGDDLEINPNTGKAELVISTID